MVTGSDESPDGARSGEPGRRGRGLSGALLLTALAWLLLSPERARASAPPPAPPAARDAPADWPQPPRRHVHGAAFVFGMLGVLLIMLASTTQVPCWSASLLDRVGIPCVPSVVVDMRSEALTFVPDTTLDLVALAQRGPDGAAGIRLRPAWIHVQGVHVTTPITGELVSGPIPADVSVALPAVAFQHLEVTAACNVRINRLADGWTRLSLVSESAGSERPEEACQLLGQVWSGPAPPVSPDSLADSDFYSSLPAHAPIAFRARLTGDQVARVDFLPAEHFRLRRVAVRALRFENWAYAPPVESAILDGTIRFLDLDDAEERIHVRDELRLGELRGTVLDLVTGDAIHTLYRGTASNPTVQPNRELRPSLLRQLYHSEGLRMVVVILVGMATLIAALVQAIRA